MAFNTAYDGDQLAFLSLPYNKSERDLSDMPRLIAGQNMYVTPGGTLAKRPGTFAQTTETATSHRIDRIWSVRSLDVPARLFMVASVHEGSTGYWKIMYKEMPTTYVGVPAWSSMGTYRDLHQSQRPHEAIEVNGKLYIMGFPNTPSTERQGTVVFDAQTEDVSPWGFEGPPLNGVIFEDRFGVYLSANLDDSATSFTADQDVTTGGTGAVLPFVMNIDYEQVLVTGPITGVGPYNYTNVTRGYNDTEPQYHRANTIAFWYGWTPSSEIVTVNQSWKYSFAYKGANGHVSNRVADRYNDTKPFFDMCPNFIGQGAEDNTLIPTSLIYRTTDGGGTYYYLDEVANPGGIGPLSFWAYEDNTDPDASGLSPIQDKYLNQGQQAPTTLSNSPPPRCNLPAITGTDPIAPSTRLVYFQGRIWYGIGNILYFSGNEEITEGIPEHCFPSGLRGNYIRYQTEITNLECTAESLYVGTVGGIHEITGTNLETFASRPIYDQYGMMPDQPRATTKFGDTVVFMSSDYRIMMLDRSEIRTISTPLDSDIIEFVLSISSTDNVQIDLNYWGDRDKEWIIVSALCDVNQQSSRHWVYDIIRSKKEGKDFWFTPWIIRSTAVYSGYYRAENPERHLVFFQNNTTHMRSASMSFDTYDDYTGTSDLIIAHCTMNLMSNPAGNHVNKLREPGMTSVLQRVVAEHTVDGSAPADPTMGIYFDSILTSLELNFNQETPARRPASEGYKTVEHHIYRVCQRASLRFTAAVENKPFELQNVALIWQPESGA